MALDAIREPLRRRWRTVLTCVAAATLAQASGIPLALGARRLVRVAEGGGDILTPASLLIAIVLLRSACRAYHVARGEALAQHVVADLRARMADHVLRLPLGYFDRKRAGSMVLRFVSDATSLRTWIARTLITAPADVLTIITALVALATLSPWLAASSAVPLLLLLPLHAFAAPRARDLTREGRREQARLSGDVSDVVDGLAAYKAVGTTPEIVGERIVEVRDLFSRRARLDALSRGVALASGSFTAVFTAISGAALLRAGRVSSADLLGAVWISLVMRGPVVRLAQADVVNQRARVAMERVAALLQRRPEPGLDGGEPYDGTGMRIRFKGVGYRERDGRWTVRGLDATLRGPGLVVVRGVGRGASRVFELVLRLRRPQEGRLALDGTRASRLSTRDVRAHIAWLDRDRRVARLVGVEGSPTDVLEGVVRDRRLALLHDPTAGLDAEAAADVRAGILRAAETRLVLVATLDDELMRRAATVIAPRTEPMPAQEDAHE